MSEYSVSNLVNRVSVEQHQQETSLKSKANKALQDLQTLYTQAEALEAKAAKTAGREPALRSLSNDVGVSSRSLSRTVPDNILNDTDDIHNALVDAINTYNNEIDEEMAFVNGGMDVVERLMMEMLKVSAERAKNNPSLIYWELEQMVQTVVINAHVIEGRDVGSELGVYFTTVMQIIGYGNRESRKLWEGTAGEVTQVMKVAVEAYNSNATTGVKSSPLLRELGKFIVDNNLTNEGVKQHFNSTAGHPLGMSSTNLDQISPGIKLHILADVSNRLGFNLTKDEYLEFMSLSKKEISDKYYGGQDCIVQTAANNSNLQIMDGRMVDYLDNDKIMDDFILLANGIPQQDLSEEHLQTINRLADSAGELLNLLKSYMNLLQAMLQTMGRNIA